MAQKQTVLPYDYAPVYGDLGMFLEKRISYDGSNNPEYIGYNREPNAATDIETWLVFKMTYTGTNLTRYQLPDDGVQWKYTWDDRATYFT